MNEKIKVIGGINLKGIRQICELIEKGKQTEAAELLNDLQNDILFIGMLDDLLGGLKN